MINQDDSIRIRADAYIAVDALESLIYALNLSEDYIKEKLGVVKSCVRFIENYEK